jgi:Xaa-Pro aminopeptidase
MSEHQIWAELEYQCRMGGAQQLSFVPVVASGRNSLILHYIENNQLTRYFK